MDSDAWIDGRRRWLRRLLRTRRGAMTLTMSHAFLGSITIGVGLYRGAELNTSIYVEGQLGHTNYAASKLSGDHARSANIATTNNVISSAIIGPRFAVEADNLTMLANAAIACPQSKNPKMAQICRDFTTNYPRMLAKLAWVRLKQMAIWKTLGNLTQAIDRVASIRALEQITSLTTGIDPMVSMRAVDPAMTMNLWATNATAIACQNAMTDVLPTIMPGSAFPVLIRTNLLVGLPKALVQIMPRLLCGMAAQAVSSAMSGGGGGGSGGEPKPPADPNACEGKVTQPLPELPEVARKAGEACDAEERSMREALAMGAPCEKGLSPYAEVERPHAVRALTPAEKAHADSAAESMNRCTFNRKKCDCDMLEKESATMLSSVGLPTSSKTSAGSLGGMVLAPTAADFNHSDTMRACAFASRPLDATVIRINDAAQTLLSFGGAPPSRALRRHREYETCGRWYFPETEGIFAGLARTQQAFVAGWRSALVGPKGGSS